MEGTRQRVYDKEQYEADKQNLADAESGKKAWNWTSFTNLMIHELCTETNILQDYKVGGYTLEEIRHAIHYPVECGKMLIDVSRHLMTISPFYMRVNQYFSHMGLFHYVIDTYDLKQSGMALDPQGYLADYARLCGQLEKMNLPHEFQKIMNVLPSEDLFCGLLYENANDFYIMRVPPSFCKIAFVQDGIYNFQICLSRISKFAIVAYPEDVQAAWTAYMEQKDFLDGWYMPPAQKQICVKWNESSLYPVPFLIMMAQDIFDIDTYKKLKLQKARVDNYKAIVVEIPLDEKFVDKPLVTEETITDFAKMNRENMPDDVGMLHVLGNAEAVSFKDNTNNGNNLSDAITNFYDAAGVPSSLFNGSTVSSSMKLAIENDAAMVYGVYRQLERWVNRWIKLRKFNRKNYKFAFRLHNATVFNHDTVTDAYLKAAEHGLPFKLDYAASLGLSAGRVLGNLFTENNALQLHERLIPLPTSYTMSYDDVGRPTNESMGLELSASGEQTVDNDSNENR